LQSCGNGKNVDTHYHIAVGKFVFGTTKKDLTSWTHPINMSGSFEIDESAAYKTRGFFSVDSSTPYIALPNGNTKPSNTVIGYLSALLTS